MDQEIYFTNKEFDFSKISISQPISVQGGAYFTKIRFNNTPLYIQTPKCYTKQGLNETNKKAYIDLMFTNEDDEVIEWFEHLEEHLIGLIYEKRELWFQNEMEREDIENFFNPICRAFRGGKFHLIRVNIPKNKTISSQYYCNVYDENENIIHIQDLNESHSIIPCVEVQGIKFSARNFQMELVGKQIMLINNKPIFNSCVIKRATNKGLSEIENDTSVKNIHHTENDTYNQRPNNVTEDIDMLLSSKNIDNEIIEPHPQSELVSLGKCVSNDRGVYNVEVQENNISPIKGLQNKIIEDLVDSEEDNLETQEDTQRTAEYSECNKDSITKDIKELIDVVNNTNTVHNTITPNHLEETIKKSDVIYLEDITNNLKVDYNRNLTLKKPNEVYYEIYKIAKDKAKQHKKAAITHYLEAKKIKNTYLLDDLDNSDDSTDDDNDNDNDNDTNDSNKIKNHINEIIEELI